jgi:hypothetical protein
MDLEQAFRQAVGVTCCCCCCCLFCSVFLAFFLFLFDHIRNGRRSYRRETMPMLRFIHGTLHDGKSQGMVSFLVRSLV